MNEFEDIQENFFRFDEPGTMLEGTYVKDLGASERYPFHIHCLDQAATGKNMKFHGNSQLDALLAQIVEGDYIIVTFVEFVPTPRGEMKRFSVQRRKGQRHPGDRDAKAYQTQNDRLPGGLF